MTTIVATREGIWSDSQMTSGNERSKAIKVFRINGSVFGMAGTVIDCYKFLQWAQDMTQPPPKMRSREFCILQVALNGIFSWEGDFIPIKLHEKYATTGSGHAYALGALSAGATPSEAIKIACKCDVYSGGAVRKLLLKV